MAIGAEGILHGSRFLATVESPLHANFKQAIVDSDGHDTQLSEIPDIAAGLVWPGAMTRSRRNRFVERWAGREWALRQGRAEAIARLRAARESGDVDEGPLSMGQDAGLVHDIPRAADIVARIAQERDTCAQTSTAPCTDGVTNLSLPGVCVSGISRAQSCPCRCAVIFLQLTPS
jgi:NAD(P)H-dependent flavin oxidoreductase YrpB (nitropropane dioxygenase family)